MPPCNCPLAAGATNPATTTARARLLSALASSVIRALWTVDGVHLLPPPCRPDPRHQAERPSLLIRQPQRRGLAFCFLPGRPARPRMTSVLARSASARASVRSS